MIRLVSLLAAFALVGSAAAQAPPAPQSFPPTPADAPAAAAAPKGPLYQVELLVFAHRDFDPNEEHFEREAPPEIPQVVDLREVPVYDESSFELPAEPAPLEPGALAPPEQPPPPADEPFRVRVLRPDELQLMAQARVLARLPAYHLLVHSGWIQEGLPENQTLPFDVALLGTTNPSGAVRVYLSRFLHIALDLSYRGGAQPAAATAPGELAEVRLAPRYRLDTERQVRSGELHYFDHPAFGVLVKITPVPTNAPSATGSRPAA